MKTFSSSSTPDHKSNQHLQYFIEGHSRAVKHQFEVSIKIFESYLSRRNILCQICGENTGPTTICDMSTNIGSACFHDFLHNLVYSCSKDTLQKYLSFGTIASITSKIRRILLHFLALNGIAIPSNHYLSDKAFHRSLDNVKSIILKRQVIPNYI